MTMSELAKLYEEMKGCQACRLRKTCRQVVTAVGNVENPALMIIGESPGESEDIAGEPFVGQAGQVLRAVLRETNIINRDNTLISNVIRCRPPANKFPTDECPSICVSRWLRREIGLAKPKRMLLMGNTPLEFVAGLTGITSARGKWLSVMGIRTMSTFHPSYILRKDREGDRGERARFEQDINEVAAEIKTQSPETTK